MFNLLYDMTCREKSKFINGRHKKKRNTFPLFVGGGERERETSSPRQLTTNATDILKFVNAIIRMHMHAYLICIHYRRKHDIVVSVAVFLIVLECS